MHKCNLIGFQSRSNDGATSPNQKQNITSFLKNRSHKVQHCEILSFLWHPKASKHPNYLRESTRLRWKAQECSCGTIYLLVEIGTSTTWQITGMDTVRMDIVNEQAVLHDANPQLMDVDEPSWIDEDVPEQTRVSSP